MKIRASALLLFAFAAAGCGYRTYIAPAPAQAHQGEPLPVHAAVSVTDASSSKDVSRSLLGYDGATVRSFLTEYILKTRLFAQTDAAFPGDVEIFVTVLSMETTASETPLQSQENHVESMVRLQYRTFCRFMPNLVISGDASGFGRATSSVPLTVGHYQQAMSEALDRATSMIYRDLSAALVPHTSDIRAWAAAGKAEAAPATAPSGKQEEWEEIKPVEEKP